MVDHGADRVHARRACSRSGRIGDLRIGLAAESARTVVELTLALLLFTDAATVPLAEAEGDVRFDGGLLAIGLPLTILLGALLAVVLIPGIGWPLAAVIATILAPTDAALGLPLVSNPRIPVRIRRILVIESGLNDGIATPFLVLFLSIAESAAADHWIVQSAVEIGLAVATAVVVGGAGGWLLARARRRGFASGTPTEFAIVGLALAAYAGALAIGGNGFVAAFGAGLAFRAATGGRLHEEDGFAENLGVLASFVVWALFGAILAGPVLSRGIQPEIVLYAILSLTVIRMLPVAVALAGSGLRTDTIALIGWFGPRGLASVVFTFLTLETLSGTGAPTGIVLSVATWTVFLSILAHGLTAGPLSRLYARRLAAAPPDAPELVDVVEPRQRRLGLA